MCGVISEGMLYLRKLAFLQEVKEIKITCNHGFCLKILHGFFLEFRVWVSGGLQWKHHQWFPEASLIMVIYVSMQPLCPPSKRQSMQQEQTPLCCSVQPVPLIFTHDLEKTRLKFLNIFRVFFLISFSSWTRHVFQRASSFKSDAVLRLSAKYSLPTTSPSLGFKPLSSRLSAVFPMPLPWLWNWHRGRYRYHVIIWYIDISPAQHMC